jgi:hypothetical protein
MVRVEHNPPEGLVLRLWSSRCGPLRDETVVEGMSVAAEAAMIAAAAAGAGAGVAALAKLPARGRRYDDRDQLRLRPDPRPAQLVRLERIVEWSGESGSSAHTRLRPVLVEIAEARLAHRGLRLNRDAEEARRLLGPVVWDLVRPDRPTPQGRDAPGISPRRLGEILDALESL